MRQIYDQITGEKQYVISSFEKRCLQIILHEPNVSIHKNCLHIMRERIPARQQQHNTITAR